MVIVVQSINDRIRHLMQGPTPGCELSQTDSRYSECRHLQLVFVLTEVGWRHFSAMLRGGTVNYKEQMVQCLGSSVNESVFEYVVVVPAAVDGWIRVKLSEWRREGSLILLQCVVFEASFSR
ncbi:hypothetical protein BCR33DRAFT_290592 [Rhizoclosmatium globosum]|uniref:Uncharacterized protein n=1 Tax=Rhizoclosmatium globosum TaxID=329046 RepID=A0A1Y2AAR7_9FUNG|nr:hypothetical protein BCR33DRAFT_290592 [Rhizoclosmatium globosum]|eukprot:ORY19085.1 hypothetical protein BCR33DRAFT_290592 [Rhizoclosmatium globosum]